MIVYLDFGTIVEWIIALITLGALVFAIFQEQIKDILYPIKIEIEDHNIEGELTTTGRTRQDNYGSLLSTEMIYYFHLSVVNKSSLRNIENCKVFLKAIEILKNNEFIPVKFPVPFSFCWAPYIKDENNNILISNYRVFDFIRFSNWIGYIEPCLEHTPNNFKGFVNKNDTFRYYLEVQAKNYIQKKKVIYEITLKSNFIDNIEDMRKNLIIKRISN